MNKPKKSFHVATIHDQTANTYTVEVDGQMVGQFGEQADAMNHAELLSFVFDVGYESKTKDYEEVTEDDTYFPFELPDNFSFRNNFAGNE